MKKYDLCLRGKTYSGITLAEARQFLSEVYSYAYIDELVKKANANAPSIEIDLLEARTKPWLVDGMRMNEKTAMFHCEWKGCSREESEALLRGNKLCAEAQETIKAIRETCKRIDALCSLSKS